MKPIWQPSQRRVEAANLTAFIRAVENVSNAVRYSDVLDDFDSEALDLFASLPQLES